ncbi:MAG: hypothetical protein PHX08_24790 [Lachnospiraceae bacterium]|nr:hypothetical protein [Lachnospiraceae bacterium]
MEENKNKTPGFWDKYGLLILLGVLKIPFASFILVMIVFYAIYNPIFGSDPIDDSGAVEYRDTTFSVYNDSTEVMFVLSTKEKVTIQRNNLNFIGSEEYKKNISLSKKEAGEYILSFNKKIPNIFRIIDYSTAIQKLINEHTSLSIFIGPRSAITQSSINVTSGHIYQYMNAKYNNRENMDVCERCNIFSCLHNNIVSVPMNTVDHYWIE